jgi:hypothetical protein
MNLTEYEIDDLVRDFRDLRRDKNNCKIGILVIKCIIAFLAVGAGLAFMKFCKAERSTFIVAGTTAIICSLFEVGLMCLLEEFKRLNKVNFTDKGYEELLGGNVKYKGYIFAYTWKACKEYIEKFDYNMMSDKLKVDAEYMYKLEIQGLNEFILIDKDTYTELRKIMSNRLLIVPEEYIKAHKGLTLADVRTNNT